MKINHGYPDPQANSALETGAASRAQELAKSRGASETGGAGRTDEVNLSSLASALQDALTESPEREAYLEKLSAAFAEGSYQPDIAGTVKGIVDDAIGARLEEPGPSKG
jgi:hypothetical protein